MPSTNFVRHLLIKSAQKTVLLTALQTLHISLDKFEENGSMGSYVFKEWNFFELIISNLLNTIHSQKYFRLMISTKFSALCSLSALWATLTSDTDFMLGLHPITLQNCWHTTDEKWFLIASCRQ